MTSNMMTMVVVDCGKYHEFCFSQILSTKLMGTKGLSNLNVDFFGKVDALKLLLVRVLKLVLL